MTPPKEEFPIPTPGSYAPRIFTNANHVQLSRQEGQWTLRESDGCKFEYVSRSEFDLTISRARELLSQAQRERDKARELYESLRKPAEVIRAQAMVDGAREIANWIEENLAEISDASTNLVWKRVHEIAARAPYESLK